MIDNIMIVDQIDLKEYMDDNIFPNMIYLTQEEYDLIHIKDITIIYVITNAVDKRVYYGNVLILDECADRTYLVGPIDTHGYYPIYLNQKEGYNDRLINISKFKSPEKAITAINHFNRVGSHFKWDLQTYNIITKYIDNIITCHDLIVGIIALFGYRDDIRLQDLISLTLAYGVALPENKEDLPIPLKDDMTRWIIHNNHLYVYYVELYNMIVKYNYFKDSKYQKKNVDMSDVVNDVFDIITKI